MLKNYPKLLLFGTFSVLAYLLHALGFLPWISHVIGAFGYGYLSLFIAGLFFSFGFTTAFAIIYFIDIGPLVHPLAGALIAATGASLADLAIFRFGRFSLHGEFLKLQETSWFRKLYSLFHHERISEKIRRYLLFSFAGIIIASPLPDELGVTLLSGVTEINERAMTIICFLLNALGIFLFLLLGGAMF